jgi:hypothetical protein
MPIKFYCPKCEQKLGATDEMVGTIIDCPICGQAMRVPGAAPAAAAPRKGVWKTVGLVGWIAAALLVTVGGIFFMRPGSSTRSPRRRRSRPPPRREPVVSTAPARRPAPEQPRDVDPAPSPAPTPETSRDDDVPVVAKAAEPPGRTVVSPPPEPLPAPSVVVTPAKEAFSAAERRKIFLELMAADERASREAKEEFPEDPTQCLAVGATMSLARHTPLLSDLPWSRTLGGATPDALRMGRGMSIKVLEVRTEKGIPWYRVEATGDSHKPPEEGWVSGAALRGQSGVSAEEQHKKQAQRQKQLLAKFRREIQGRFHLSVGQSAQILNEGIHANWLGGESSEDLMLD